jgi:multidrug efflux system membrane fusion protein
MWKELLCAVAATGLALGAVAGCSRAPAAAGGYPPALVTTAPAVSADVPLYLDEIGKTTASEMVTIRPQVAGKIIERNFEDGADLTQSEKLFAIDPRPFQATLDAATATLEQSKAQVAEAQTNFDRMSSLLASKAVAQQDYDDKQNALAVAVANEKANEASVESAQLNLEYCTISSPIDGRASARLVDAGNVVTANTTDLLVITKVSPIYVDFTASESDLNSIRQSMAGGALKVQVQVPDNPNESVEGELTFLDNMVQDGTGTVKLRATLGNQDRRFWPGQFVHVRLILSTLHDAILIPSDAVQIGQTGTYVFVVGPGNIAQQQPVKEGQRQGDQVVIESGLKPGDTIIKSGQLMVMPGAPVMPLPPPGAPAAGNGGGQP